MPSLILLALLLVGIAPVSAESEDVSVVEIEDLIKQLIKEDSLTDFYATIPSAPAEGQGSVPAGQLEEYLNEVTTRLSPSKLKALNEGHGTSGSKGACHKPHVFLFLIDDLGFGDVSWNNPEIITPKMQALADEGIILDYNYVHAICSPSRGALMTGKYQINIGMQHGVITYQSPDCAPKDTEFISERLKDVGYTTSLIGKWHLGFCNIECTPLYRGFDSFYGFYQPFQDYYSHLVGFRGDTGFDFRDGLESVRGCVNGTYLTDLLTTRALKQIREHDPEEPLFMYFAHAGVHIPLQVPHRFLDLYPDEQNEERKIIKAMASSVDESIGEVVAAIKDSGMYKNSIIIITSDNGGQANLSSNYPLRGAKQTLYEGGNRVPGIFHSPLQTVPGGTRSKEMFHITDWHATIAGLAGACSEQPCDLDGVDQSNMLLHGGPNARSLVIYNADDYYPQYYGSYGIRIGDYKLLQGYPGMYDGWSQYGGVGYTHELDLLNNPPEITDLVQNTILTSRATNLYEEIRRRDDQGWIRPDYEAIDQYILDVLEIRQLYNVVGDPEERNNLADSKPEVVLFLRKMMEQFAANARPVHLESTFDVPEASPSNFNGVWDSGWC